MSRSPSLSEFCSSEGAQLCAPSAGPSVPFRKLPARGRESGSAADWGQMDDGTSQLTTAAAVQPWFQREACTS